MLIMFIIAINRCGRHSCDLPLKDAFLSHFALISHACEAENAEKGGGKLSNFFLKILSMHKLTQDLPSSAIQNMEPLLASKLLSCTFPSCWAHCCSPTCNYGCQTKATTHVRVAVFIIFFLISKVNAAELCSRTKCLAATERFLSS